MASSDSAEPTTSSPYEDSSSAVTEPPVDTSSNPYEDSAVASSDSAGDTSTGTSVGGGQIGSTGGGGGGGSNTSSNVASTDTSGTTTPAATNFASLSGLSSLGNSNSSPFVTATPQILKNDVPMTAAKQPSAKTAQLQQLYQSLTPELQDAFAAHGIEAPEAAARGGSIGHYDTGGTTIPGLNDLQNFFTNATPKSAQASPAILEAAKVVDQPSRIAALKQLRSGLSGSSQASGLAAGGLPHKYAEAAPEGHNPEFITGVTGYYAQGGGTGQSDDIPAMLHDGDYVIDAEAVSALGDGSSKAGAEALAKFQSQFRHHDDGASRGKPVPAKIADGEYVFPAAFVTALGGGNNKRGAKLLDKMRVELRMHKRAAPTSKIPPKAESPLDYLKMAKG